MPSQKGKQMSAAETQTKLPPQRARARRAFLPAPTFSCACPQVSLSLCSARSLLCYPELSIALIYHFVQPFALAVFSGERDSGGNLASGPKLKGSRYRV